MMAAYFGDDAPHHTAIGLGTTATYLAPGGLPDWIPSRPWTHVLTTRPQPVEGARRVVWSNAVYTLSAAPVLDVTTYGTGWYPPEQDGRGHLRVDVRSRPGGRVQPERERATARLRMAVGSYARPRILTITREPGRDTSGSPPGTS